MFIKAPKNTLINYNKFYPGWTQESLKSQLKGAVVKVKIFAFDFIFMGRQKERRGKKSNYI